MNSTNPINTTNSLTVLAAVLIALLCIACEGGDGKNTTPPLQADITLPEINREIKAGESVYFDGTTQGGQPPYTYTWRFGVGIADSKEKTPGNVTFAFEGSYNVQLTVTDADKRAASDKVIIEVIRNELTPG